MANRVAHGHVDRLDRARDGGGDGHLHLHGLERADRIALLDAVPNLDHSTDRILPGMGAMTTSTRPRLHAARSHRRRSRLARRLRRAARRAPRPLALRAIAPALPPAS